MPGLPHPRRHPIPSQPPRICHPRLHPARLHPRRLHGLLISALLAAAILAGSPLPGQGGELLTAIRRSHAAAFAPAPYAGNPRQIAPRVPGYAVSNPWQQPAPAGCHGLGGVHPGGVPRFAWGYFGVKKSSHSFCHRGYYGNLYQFQFREGY